MVYHHVCERQAGPRRIHVVRFDGDLPLKRLRVSSFLDPLGGGLSDARTSLKQLLYGSLLDCGVAQESVTAHDSAFRIVLSSEYRLALVAKLIVDKIRHQKLIVVEKTQRELCPPQNRILPNWVGDILGIYLSKPCPIGWLNDY